MANEFKNLTSDIFDLKSFKKSMKKSIEGKIKSSPWSEKFTYENYYFIEGGYDKYLLGLFDELDVEKTNKANVRKAYETKTHKLKRDMRCLTGSARNCFNYFFNRFRGNPEICFEKNIKIKDGKKTIRGPGAFLDFYYKDKDGNDTIRCHFVECKCMEPLESKGDLPYAYKNLLKNYFESLKINKLSTYNKEEIRKGETKIKKYFALTFKNLGINPPSSSELKDSDFIIKGPIDIKQMLCHLFAIQTERGDDQEGKYFLDYYFFLNNEYAINGYQYTIKTWFDAVVKGLKETNILKNANGEYCIDLNINFVCIDEKDKNDDYIYKYI